MRARAIGGCREVQKMKNLSLVNLVTSRDLARSQRVPGVFRQAPAWGNRALAEACIMQGCSGKNSPGETPSSVAAQWGHGGPCRVQISLHSRSTGFVEHRGEHSRLWLEWDGLCQLAKVPIISTVKIRRLSDRAMVSPMTASCHPTSRQSSLRRSVHSY